MPRDAVQEGACESERTSEQASRIHTRVHRPGLSSVLFYTMRNRGPGAPRRGKVARAICPRIAALSSDKENERQGERERESESEIRSAKEGERGREMNKNQAPKALPSWHASTSQPLSLNRITSRGLRRGFLLLSSPPPLSTLFPLLPFYVPPPPREAALFLKLVLLLLLGSTCRHHAGVFVLRIPRAQLETRRGPWSREKITRE